MLLTQGEVALHFQVASHNARDSNPYVPPANSITPLAGVTHAVHCLTDNSFCTAPVNSAAPIRGATYPSAYAKRSAAPVTGFLVVLTYASRVAKIGVLHGDAAKAKVSPARYAESAGGTSMSRVSMFSDGSCKGRTSRRPRPMTMATRLTRMGRPSPIWPYAPPRNEETSPRAARVVARPEEKATALVVGDEEEEDDDERTVFEGVVVVVWMVVILSLVSLVVVAMKISLLLSLSLVLEGAMFVVGENPPM